MGESLNYLHHHSNFSDLLNIVGHKKNMDPALIEKDYWIMHCLYGLQKMGLSFQLKGGTSLSKGYQIIHRFSEDIDIRIEPLSGMTVYTGRNQNKPSHCNSRRDFYNALQKRIKIDGIDSVERDKNFDDEKFRSGGIRLLYHSRTSALTHLKEGILLEVGFDDVSPNKPRDITSWAYDHAVANRVPVKDNRARKVRCYDPGYTFVEKLQTISTKYRKITNKNSLPENFMRHYYDVYCLLKEPSILNFIGTADYHAHKKKRFRDADHKIIHENEAFTLTDPLIRNEFKHAYEKSRTLYYQGQPDFDEVVALIQKHSHQL
ncbi:nucleotidyl transferase AbiEii/AbiGii toxin family protein [Candidatus Nucleicultrix amoebiphila]|jgi:hypothetical protein|uniref:Nucleotidyl transferase AbiEii/AbiGii toxin family protein n=1 Tax=Candidatus Nucleicultrix amoebiphila FS5 TaxID=1414854 RepID=A0A1W6N579_9PROT|nr:nucleotidyl transferase AbiEii/AbiGii toxin family protein [Candidatus Nucleicultrix amoebiphila]ARN85007.1 hypothetical protein GQ61_06570 [Candidatus Nucleicultrix amoebiphila FS5]